MNVRRRLERLEAAARTWTEEAADFDVEAEIALAKERLAAAGGVKADQRPAREQSQGNPVHSD